jgi:hypothetical protein
MLQSNRQKASAPSPSPFREALALHRRHADPQSGRALREECGSCVNSSQRLVHSGY